MAYSYTSIKEFHQCPKRWYENRILKRWPFKETEATQYGNKVHKALEEAARANVGDPAATLPYSLSGYQYLADAIQRAKASGMVAIPEQTIGMTYDGNGVRGRKDIWWGSDVKIAGICDISLLTNDFSYARIGDYKTGSDKYPDIEQLDLMALLTFVEYPTVQTIDAMLMFVKQKSTYPTTPKRYTREDMKEINDRFDVYITDIEQHKSENHFPDNGGNALCGWCVVEDCPFYKEFLPVRLRKERNK